MSRRRLSFYDHDRQNYAKNVTREPRTAGEFMIGDHVRSGGVDSRGEFKILLHDFARTGGWGSYRGSVSGPRIEEPLAVQLCVFDDAHGALREFIKLGGLEAIKKHPPYTRDDLSRLLIGLGIRDGSNNPLPKEKAA